MTPPKDSPESPPQPRHTQPFPKVQLDKQQARNATSNEPPANLRDDPQFIDELNKGIAAGIRKYFDKFFQREAPQSVIEDTQYETALGAFIISQNPYAIQDNMVLPRIPEGANEETRWVRKSGVLRKYSAFYPLPKEEAIPAGELSTFTFEDWDHLRDDYEAGVELPAGPAPTIPPEYPPDKAEQYTHNVVKVIRLRYTLKNRRFDGDEHLAFIKIHYTGNDH